MSYKRRRRRVYLTIDSPDIVKVYVGNPLAIYTVRRSNLEQSLVLQSTVSFNTSDGYFAMSPLLSRIDPDDFQSVADYLALSEYSPFIVDAGTDHAYLDELAGDAESREEIIRCGILFKIAQQLELPRLQALTLSKFKALQPYPAYEFLVVCGTAFESGLAGDARLDDFLIQYFAVSVVNPHFSIPSPLCLVRNCRGHLAIICKHRSYPESTKS